MKVDEGIVARGVLIAERHRSGGRLGRLRVIDRVQHRVAASRGFASGVIAHIAHVRFPGFAYRIELIRKSLDACGIHATGTDGLAVGSKASLNKIRVDLAVAASLRCGRLAAEHSNIIIEAHVARAVVLRQENALRRECLREIRCLGRGAERYVIALISPGRSRRRA